MRVALTIGTLHGKTNARREDALVLFLQVLADTLNPENSLHGELLTIANELENELAQTSQTAPGTPASLLQHLQNVLSGCPEFESDSYLQSVFVDSRIRPWRNAIPKAESIAQRVSGVIEVLYRNTDDHRQNALMLFLYVLAEMRDPEDALRDDLMALALELEELLSSEEGRERFATMLQGRGREVDLHQFEPGVMELPPGSLSATPPVTSPEPPTPDFHGKLSQLSSWPRLALTGEAIPVKIEVLNLSNQLWPANGPAVVQVTSRVYDTGTQEVVEEYRQFLLEALPPDKSLEVDLRFKVPTAGDYGVAWYIAAGESRDYQERGALNAPKPVQVLGEAELLAGLKSPPESPGARKEWIENIGQLAKREIAPDLKRSIVELGLVPALFDAAEIGKAAIESLHALYEINAELVQPLLCETLANRRADLAPVYELTAPRRTTATTRKWLESLLPGKESTHQSPRVSPDTESRSPTHAVDSTSTPVVTVYTPLSPPPSENTVTVEVSPEFVVVEHRGTQYKSPNRLNLAALADKSYGSPRTYGELLFKGIFHTEAAVGFEGRSTYDGFVIAGADKGNLRFALSLHSTFATYKWEYLWKPDDGEPLAVREGTPFYRLDCKKEVRVVGARPIKIVAAICNPTTLGPESKNLNLRALSKLDVAQQRDILEAGLKRLQKAGLVEYTLLDGEDQRPPATFDNIKETLQEGYHVLHILAHGLYIAGKYYLVMEMPDRKHDLVPVDRFDKPVLGHRLRLVVLAACHSGISDTGETFHALGPHLLKLGVPAVIAMQDRVPVETVQLFTQRFYDDLARSGRIDMAMAATRYDIYNANRQSGDWGIPVLLMSTDDGRLFKVDEESARQKLPPLQPEIRSYAELAGNGDPRPRLLAESFEARACEYGVDQATLGTLRAVIAPSLAGAFPRQEAESFAPRQDRNGLSRELNRPFEIAADGLEAYVRLNGKLDLPSGTYAQVASALNSGKHIILIGPPGNGKTCLAHQICAYAKAQHLSTDTFFTTATADWTTFDTVGGYIPTAQQTLEFRPGVFLKAICAGQWLVIDEINRAEIDKAFGELFTVLSGQQVDLSYMVGKHQVRVLPPLESDSGDWVPQVAREDGCDYVVHPHWRIVGTMNVYDKSYLFQMSFAFMRRFAFIDVDLPDHDAFMRLCDKWIGGCPLAEAPDSEITDLQEKLKTLLQADSVLMRLRALGPAIVKDMIHYVGDRYKHKNDSKLPDLLGEAFLLYAVPQLDGLDHEEIRKIFEEIHGLLGQTSAHRSIVARIQSLYPHASLEK
ncbi:MAG: CHAT domain-containing protein [Anaerolineae bacterium]|nr:CHAT domain-containing protein [Anaerolineae bacterium]